MIEQEIERYQPLDEREAADQELILYSLRRGDALWTRENPVCHWTASAWVVNQKGDKVLMAYHNIYGSWAWTGGHADGEQDLAAVARREVEEETGLTQLRLVVKEPIGLDVLPVPAHIKRGKAVASHLHFNLTYLFEGDEQQPLRVKADENSKVGWIPVEELSRYVTEQEMLPVYERLCRRAKEWGYMG